MLSLIPKVSAQRQAWCLSSHFGSIFLELSYFIYFIVFIWILCKWLWAAHNSKFSSSSNRPYKAFIFLPGFFFWGGGNMLVWFGVVSVVLFLYHLWNSCFVLEIPLGQWDFMLGFFFYFLKAHIPSWVQISLLPPSSFNQRTLLSEMNPLPLQLQIFWAPNPFSLYYLELLSPLVQKAKSYYLIDSYYAPWNLSASCNAWPPVSEELLKIIHILIQQPSWVCSLFMLDTCHFFLLLLFFIHL